MKFKNIIFGIFAIVFLSMPIVASAAPDGAESMSLVSVHGIVSDDFGSLSGVNISVLGTNEGTVTNLEGGYVIAVPKGSTLKYSYIGFNPVEKKVDSQGSRIEQNIKMKETAIELEGATVLRVSPRTLYDERTAAAIKELHDSWASAITAAMSPDANPSARLSKLVAEKARISRVFTEKMNDTTEGKGIKQLLKGANITERAHQKTIDDNLAKLVVPNDLQNEINAAKKMVCDDATENLKAKFLTQWNAMKDAAERESPDVATRLQTLQESKDAMDKNLKSELDALYTNGDCKGFQRPNDLLGIGVAYKTLLDSLREQLSAAQRTVCDDATENLKAKFLTQWNAMKDAAERESPDVATRLQTLQESKDAMDKNLKSELDALYTNGDCKGFKKPNDLLGIDVAYKTLVESLKGQMSVAQKNCEDAKEPLVAELKSAWAEAQRIAKDNKAYPEPSEREALASAVIDPVIEKYRRKMTELHETGVCRDVSKWDASTDKYFQKVLLDWEALKRKLRGEGPVDYQDPAKLKELQEKAEQAKATEQSTANKMLGAGSMLLSGIGGMQLAQGMAEKAADKDGTAEMEAYTSTFRCGIGDANRAQFNLRNEGKPHLVPAYSVATMALKTEYREKVDFLLEKKAALGMLPGIEAELIQDTSNLYVSDAMGTERTNRFDTAAERLESGSANTRMLVGGAALGLGVVGGAVGNAIINKDKGDDKADKDSNAKQQPQQKSGGTPSSSTPQPTPNAQPTGASTTGAQSQDVPPAQGSKQSSAPNTTPETSVKNSDESIVPEIPETFAPDIIKPNQNSGIESLDLANVDTWITKGNDLYAERCENISGNEYCENLKDKILAVQAIKNSI